MLHNLEMLAKTNVVEVTGRSLCAEFVGQTSPKVDEAMKTALGGVLFIGAQTAAVQCIRVCFFSVYITKFVATAL